MSDSSALSSPLSSAEELLDDLNHDGSLSDLELESPAPAIEKSPIRKKRPASPPHEEVLADNPDIAVIVMFRSRFNEAFPAKMSHLGPQDIEKGIVDPLPSPLVDSLLCALLSLVLNRKKPIERGQYTRALEEAIQTQKHQWPRAWNGINPLHGNNSFKTMNPQERLILLKTLVIWSLHSSEAISAIIKESYKQARKEQDLNQPLSVQPWGTDGDKRRYWLIEGQDDTNFRLYRESNPALVKHTWRSMAGNIEELRVVAQKLAEDGSQAGRRLSQQIINAIPRFEATEEKRKRREYRLARKAQFTRPDPGFSLYEGRTRGKRMRYTFSDEEDEGSDATSARRSTRQSGRVTPSDGLKPTVTASGRQVRSRVGGLYGESLLSGQAAEGLSPGPSGEYERSDGSEGPVRSGGRATRSGGPYVPTNGYAKSRKHIDTYNSVDEMDDEEEATSSGGEWDGGDDEDERDDAADDEDKDDEDSNGEIFEEEPGKGSLIVTLCYRKRAPQVNTITKTESPSGASDNIILQPEGGREHSPTLNGIVQIPTRTNEVPNGISAVSPKPQHSSHGQITSFFKPTTPGLQNATQSTTQGPPLVELQ